MGPPEVASVDASSKEFIEWVGGVLLMFLTVGGQAWRYIRESAKEEPKRVEFEVAELGDMKPLREIVKRLDKMLDLEADVEEIKDTERKILALLERIDREDEVQRRAAELAERLLAERRARERRDG